MMGAYSVALRTEFNGFFPRTVVSVGPIDRLNCDASTGVAELQTVLSLGARRTVEFGAQATL